MRKLELETWQWKRPDIIKAEQNSWMFFCQLNQTVSVLGDTIIFGSYNFPVPSTYIRGVLINLGPEIRKQHFCVVGWKVLFAALTINNWFMFKSGLKQDNIASLDNHPFFCKLNHSVKQTIPSHTVLFTVHSIETLSGVDKELRTCNFNHKQWPCGIWSLVCE